MAAERWALLVGIDRYPLLPPAAQLAGCVNDARALAGALIDRFGFPAGHVTLLLDEGASQAAFRAAVRELLQKAGRDDTVVLHYSGHGSQMTDREGDEEDGLDETLVAADSGRKPHPNRDITDDEVYVWLRDLTAATHNVTLIFDCCHSGTIARGDAFAERVREIEPDLRPASQLPPSPLAPGDLLGPSRGIGAGGWRPLGDRYTLFAGCRSEERSFEHRCTATGVAHGALTYHLLRGLAEVPPGATYRDLFEEVAHRVSALYPLQHPQLEGAADRELFGLARCEPARHVLVRSRNNGQLTLGLGAACGLAPGSVWAIHLPGTRQPGPESRLGLAEVTSVRAASSEARIEEEIRPGAIQPGSRAVEHRRSLTGRALAVEVAAPAGGPGSELREALAASSLLRPAGSRQQGDARAYLLPPRAEARDGDPAPGLGALAQESWVLVGKGDVLLAPPRPAGETSAVLLDLERVARCRLALDLANPGSPLAGRVELHLGCRIDGRWAAPRQVDGKPVLDEGELLALRLVNDAADPLYLYVLELGAGSTIDLLYPVTGAEKPLMPGRSLEVGVRLGDELEVYLPLPEELPPGPAGAAVESTEIVKLFASTHPLDLRSLLHPGSRGADLEGDLGELLPDLLAFLPAGEAARSRGARRPPARPQEEDREEWVTVERSFLLRRG